MTGPTSVHDLCVEYLDAVGDILAGTPGGTIGRSFVSPGFPAIDCCPMVCVYAVGPSEPPLLPGGPLNPGLRATVSGPYYVVQLSALVARCLPASSAGEEPPPAADLTAAAAVHNADGWTIWVGLHQRVRAGTLFAAPSSKREVFFLPPAPLTPEGGCSGWTLDVQVQLDGWAP